MKLHTDSITKLLDTPDPEMLQDVLQQAKSLHPGRVLIRGIVEITSYCRQSCAYCGIRRQNSTLQRYRMTAEQILKGTERVHLAGVQTVVIQGGEDPKLEPEWMAEIIGEIRQRWPNIAITLSLGEQSRQTYARWKQAGADRYLLKVETSNPEIYSELHPGMSLENRIRCLNDIIDVGFVAGSGIIVGLPGQTAEILAKDLQFLQRKEIGMISIGPLIPHPDTPLSHLQPGSIETTLAALALMRCLRPDALMPAVSALAAGSEDLRHRGLIAGGDVIMPNFTPADTAKLYSIYPHSQRGRKNKSLQQALDQISLAGLQPDFSRDGGGH